MKISIPSLCLLVTMASSYAMEVAQDKTTQEPTTNADLELATLSKMAQYLEMEFEYIPNRYAPKELVSLNLVRVCGLVTIYNEALEELQADPERFLKAYTDLLSPRSVIYRTMRDSVLSDETYQRLRKIIELIRQFNRQQTETNFDAINQELIDLLKAHEETLERDPENEMVGITLPGLQQAHREFQLAFYNPYAMVTTLSAITEQINQTIFCLQARYAARGKLVLPSRFKKLGETYERIPNYEYLFMKENKDLQSGSCEAQALISSHILVAYFSKITN